MQKKKTLESNTDWLSVWQTLKNASASNLTKCIVLPKMLATGGQGCSVELLNQYLRRHPQELRDKGHFYLTIIENLKINVGYITKRLA